MEAVTANLPEERVMQFAHHYLHGRDEIDRLQRELAAARAEVACLTAYRDGLAKNVAELEAANERLRAEALQRGVNDLWADRMDASDWTRS